MIGGHDLGGQQGMGPIGPEPETEEPVFHSPWERRVFALTLATGMLGKWNIDESRHARERQDPITYVENSYYENWLEGLETLLLEKGLLSAEELEVARAGASSAPVEHLAVPDPESAARILAAGTSSIMESSSAPLFRLGDRITVRRSANRGHTRAPRYAQGASGVVAGLLGCHSYPDSNAAGLHEGRQLYSVSFPSRELWGAEADEGEVRIDLWEPYLELSQN